MLISCLLCHTKANFNMSLGHSLLINLHVGCKKSQVHSNLCIKNSPWKEKKMLMFVEKQCL